MAESSKIFNNKEEEITNYYGETINLDTKNNTINSNPIKKIEITNSIEFNYQTLKQNSNSYLKNLEIYKKLPESMVTNIIKCRKFICKNHNILFHHYTKDKFNENNKKNSGIIQSIIINTNLKSFNKENKIVRTLSNNSNVVYHKKNLTKAKSAFNSYRQTKKNHNVSQSSIIANYETNYDYDFDNNDNCINLNDNSEKFNSLAKKNLFNDISLKEYLHNETKTLRKIKYFESKEKNTDTDNTDIEKNINTEKNKNKNKNIRTIQLDLKINSDISPFLNTEKNEGKKFDFKNIEKKKNNNKNSYSNINSNDNRNNKINNKVRRKIKSQENINSYSNRYKMKKYKFKTKLNNEKNNYYHKLLLTKSYNHLSINGNFTSANIKRKTLVEGDKKNNFKRKKNNIFINTQNFYNDSKIDYVSFRKNNLNNNIKTSKQNKNTNKNNNNILKHKEEKRIPFKLIKKDLKINTSNTKKELTNIKIDSKTKRNLSLEGMRNKNENILIKEGTQAKFGKIQNSINNVVISISPTNNKFNKKEKFKNKIENNKKKVFEFKFNQKQKQKQINNDSCKNKIFFNV